VLERTGIEREIRYEPVQGADERRRSSLNARRSSVLVFMTIGPTRRPAFDRLAGYQQESAPFSGLHGDFVAESNTTSDRFRWLRCLFLTAHAHRPPDCRS
jgi:hypothetical protein